MSTSQSASALLMIKPSSFGYDEQTAITNTFQNEPSGSQATIQAQAQAEFQAYVDALRAQDIQLTVFDDSPTPPKPNGVFPNNWITTWPDGKIYHYPMATASRRVERSPAVVDHLAQTHHLNQTIDLSAAETSGQFLEGTGAIVFDHIHKIAYACLSPRCHEALFSQHITELGYTPVVFRAHSQGAAIYHTNVLMGVQTTTAVICSAAITDSAERQRVIGTLRTTGRDIVDITPEQMNNFCGNVLEVKNRQGRSYLVLSAAAHAAFTPHQIEQLSRDKTLLPVAIPTIERIGGGSARCMIAEIFLAPRAT